MGVLRSGFRARSSRLPASPSGVPSICCDSKEKLGTVGNLNNSIHNIAYATDAQLDMK